MDARATAGLETGATLQPLQNHAVMVLVLQLYLLPDGEKGQRPGPEQAAEKGHDLIRGTERIPAGAKAHVYFELLAA